MSFLILAQGLGFGYPLTWPTTSIPLFVKCQVVWSLNEVKHDHESKSRLPLVLPNGDHAYSLWKRIEPSHKLS